MARCEYGMLCLKRATHHVTLKSGTKVYVAGICDLHLPAVQGATAYESDTPIKRKDKER
jgi:hypothetical protein